MSDRQEQAGMTSTNGLSRLLGHTAFYRDGIMLSMLYEVPLADFAEFGKWLRPRVKPGFP